MEWRVKFGEAVGITVGPDDLQHSEGLLSSVSRSGIRLCRPTRQCHHPINRPCTEVAFSCQPLLVLLHQLGSTERGHCLPVGEDFDHIQPRGSSILPSWLSPLIQQRYASGAIQR